MVYVVVWYELDTCIFEETVIDQRAVRVLGRLVGACHRGMGIEHKRMARK